MRRTAGSGNVFVDLGFDPSEADAMFRESACLMSKAGCPARFRLAVSAKAETCSAGSNAEAFEPRAAIHGRYSSSTFGFHASLSCFCTGAGTGS